MTRSLLPSLFGNQKDQNPVFRSLHDELDRVFDDFKVGMVRFGEETGNGWLNPRVDVSETETSVEVEAELPGVKEEDLDISIANKSLVLKGEKSEERKAEEKDYHLLERSKGSYMRTIPLGFDVEPDGVTAVFSEGVVTVTVAKPAEISKTVQKVPITKAT